MEPDTAWDAYCSQCVEDDGPEDTDCEMCGGIGCEICEPDEEVEP